jgi:drug/metabolite transporter (DMT)-like permease
MIMVTSGGSSSGTSTLAGNASAVASALGFAGYAVCIRSVPRRDWSPVLAGYALTTIVLCGVITLVNGNTLLPPLRDVALALGHGAVWIVGGTIMFNTATRHVGAGPMAIFAQSETVFVPIWAFLFLSERPGPATLLGGGIILGAVVGKALVDASASNRAMSAPVQG